MDQQNRPSKHVCLTHRGLMGISEDPEFDILSALADKDVLTMVRGLSKEEARSPFTDGLYGMDEKRVNAAIRKMKDAGLRRAVICTRLRLIAFASAVIASS